jgi:hypothetical protein
LIKAARGLGDIEGAAEAERELAKLGDSDPTSMALDVRLAAIIRGEQRPRVARTLSHWKADTDLVGIRDEKELAKLPEEVRVALKSLWNDVDQLLTRTVATK